MVTTTSVAEHERRTTNRLPGQIADTLRAAGLGLRGPWPGGCKVVASHVVEPDRAPGFLRVDGERMYSSAWL